MTTNNMSRQTKLVASNLMGVDNIGAGNGVSFNLPNGAQLAGIGFHPSVAFNGTTNTVTAGDGTTTFISAEDAKVTTAVATDSTSKYYPSGGTITFTLAETGSTTAGSGVAWIEYFVLDRWSENQQ